MPAWLSLASIPLLLGKLFFYYPCDHPVTYHLGSIDPRFKLSRTAAEQDLHTATGIWGQQYFLEDPTSELTVNFVYDDRQELVTQINSQETQVTADEATLMAKMNAFEAKARDFEQQVVALNSEIDEWNRQGGAPDDVYLQLTTRQQQLLATRQSLQEEANELNKSAKKFNLQVGDLNGTINSFNDLIGQKPEEGLYKVQEKEIDIYFVNTQAELVHTLAHEFGHARGLNHVTNPQGIMYAFTSQSLSPTPEDLSELALACNRISKFQILMQFLQSLTLDIRKTYDIL